MKGEFKLMTEKEQKVREIIIEYGHLRQCDCYHGQCLVLPEMLIDLLAIRINASLERKGK